MFAGSRYRREVMKEVKLPDKVRENTQGLLSQKATIESSLRMYIQGYMDSLDLKGDWNLDTNKWALSKMPKEEK